jgi:hypothetical protein
MSVRLPQRGRHCGPDLRHDVRGRCGSVPRRRVDLEADDGGVVQGVAGEVISRDWYTTAKAPVCATDCRNPLMVEGSTVFRSDGRAHRR